MDKINFQDLPNTSTPINSNNLNQMQTNIENAITKNIICARNASENITTTAESQEVFVPLSIIVAQQGNKFTLNNDGSITVGEGVTQIEASFMTSMQITSSGQTYQEFRITKNGNKIGGGIQIRISDRLNIATPITHNPVPIDVQEGDIIAAKVFNRLAGSMTLMYSQLYIKEI